MELGQAEPVGVFNNEGVDVGHVHTGFDDGGAHEDIHLMLQHLTPDLRHLVLAHLAVGEGDPGLGDPHLDAGGTAFDGFHPVVQIINLPAPGEAPAGWRR